MPKHIYKAILPHQNRLLPVPGFFLCAAFCWIVAGITHPEPKPLENVLAGAARSAGMVTVVSAASFEGDAIAPDSIVAAYGVGLATETLAAPATPLPTELGGTTVRVRDKNGVERLAQLFFVSSGQVNFLVPAAAALGQAIVTIQSGNGNVSTGEMKVIEVAAALFTANGNGKGVPAAVLLRVRADGTLVYEEIIKCNPLPCVPKPIEFSQTAERVFLVLYASGLRQASKGSVRLLLGGDEFSADFARVEAFAGLDQVNVELSRTLIGRGIVNLAVTAIGFSTSNKAEIEIAPPRGIGPMISGFSPGTAMARQTLMIQGKDFNPDREKNLVIIGGRETREVEMASPTQLAVKVPFGAATGKVAVRTPLGQGESENELPMTTSISGFVRATTGPPLVGVTVQVANSSLKVETDKEGAFVLPGVPPHNALVVDIIPPPTLPFPRLRLKQLVEKDRDNHMGKIEVQRIEETGQNALSFGSSGAPAGVRLQSKSKVIAATRSIRDGEITFAIEDNATADFPPGSANRVIFLNQIEQSRTPVELPPGVFSSTIAQLTPFGVKLTPGGKLVFPNKDNLPPNSQPRLYRFDQTPNSPTLGTFVEAGTASFSVDGKQIETLPTAVTETSIFFVAVPRPATTVIGRVLENDGTPVRGAIARANGQESTTDGNGGFTLRNVSVPDTANARLTVETSFQRPNGRVDRAQKTDIPAMLNAVTNVGNLILPPIPPNRPPVIVAPASLEITEGLMLQTTIQAYDPDSNIPLQMKLTGPGFAVLEADVNNANSHILRLAPPSASAQIYPLTITATDVDGANTPHSIQLTVRANRPPLVTAPSLIVAVPGQPLNFIVSATDPDNTPLGLVAPQTFTFSVANLPSGANLTPLPGGMTARFDWTPAVTGTFAPGFTARDNGLTPLTSEVKTTTILVGASWEQAGKIESAQTFALLTTGSEIFAATSGGVFRSANEGQTWEARNNGLTTLHVNTLALNGATLLAGTNGGGVFYSTDNGQNWINCGGLPNGIIRALAVNSRGVFAGTFGGGVLLSTDGCQNWTPVNSDLGNLKINALIASGSTVYAGTESGVFYLLDNELNWRPAGLANLKVRALAEINATLIAGTDGNGIYRSTDSGQNWESGNSGLINPATTINALAASGANVFACTSGDGVFRSSDQGRNWTALGQTGLKNLFVSSFAVSGMNNYFAGTSGGGVFRSTDQGVNWMMTNNGLATSTVNVIVANGANLYAGTAGGGVFVSSDGGQTWIANNNGLTAPYINSFAVLGGNLFAATNGGVFVASLSANPLTWTAENNGLPGAKYAIPLIAVGTTLYVGIAPDGGIYRSTDQGQNWVAMNTGLTKKEDRNIQSLISFGTRSLTAQGPALLAGTEDRGIFLSTDGGQTWQPINTGLTGLSVHALAARNLVIYAGTNNGVHRSDDDGQSWIPASAGLPAQSFVNALLVNGPNLYAGIFGGLYFSNDQGRNWAAANAGLTHNNVFALTIPNNLFAGTIGGGVYLNRLLPP